ncbi:type II toxin-antitoxin system prevent-host-death family antitoxin [Longimicrobium sp.]|jgi:prevent-host-death family protein|uniref:type II toxin-antitoxin system Phd/YefM family antitoxin n=1 Tax=Longimicrobium sp. TaxID=2029185 RepID=UPI002ED86589
MAEYAINIVEPVPLPELIRRAAAGEEVILTEGGEPVARVLTISGGNEAALMAEDSLRDWLRPEEDEAWRHLQRESCETAAGRRGNSEDTSD